MVYNHVDYFYVKNAQGDVISLIDKEGNKVVEYKYNSWGSHISVSGSMAGTLGKKNPFRYRGYYYDEETGYYYLKERYYDPKIHRFLNPDIQINPGIEGSNLFAYCNNAPINNADPSGQLSIAAFFVGVLYGAFIGAVTYYLVDTYDERGEALKGITEAFPSNFSQSEFEIINNYTGTSKNVFVYSDIHKRTISINGIHMGVLYEGYVYCNVHPYGLPKEAWIDDFHGFGYKIVNGVNYGWDQ